MSSQSEQRLVRYYADFHLVATDGQYSLVDNQTKETLYHCIADNDSAATALCAAFSRGLWEASL